MYSTVRNNIFFMNRKAYITVRTHFGDTDPFISTDVVGSVEVKSLVFADDKVDPIYGKSDADLSNCFE